MESTGPRASATYAVDMPAIVRYAGASGDFTPVHYDPATLHAAGYDDFFAMGMLVAGRLGALVVQTYGDDAVRTFHVRFQKRSWIGTDVTVTLDETADPEVVELRATAAGELIATGRAEVADASRSVRPQARP